MRGLQKLIAHIKRYGVIFVFHGLVVFAEGTSYLDLSINSDYHTLTPKTLILLTAVFTSRYFSGQ